MNEIMSTKMINMEIKMKVNEEHNKNNRNKNEIKWRT